MGYCYIQESFPGGSDSKESACSAEDESQEGLIPGSGKSPGEGSAARSSALAWKIPWTMEPDVLQSMGLQSQTRLSDEYYIQEDML